MFDKNNPYILRVEEIGGESHYFVSFRDGQAMHETEIELELYNTFREFEKQDKQQQNYYDRHMEHSELTEETLMKRAAHAPKSVEDYICEDEHNSVLWLAIGELPQTQRRRFLLYYDMEYTYEQIAEMEGCTKVAVKYTIDKAKLAIEKKIKNFVEGA